MTNREREKVLVVDDQRDIVDIIGFCLELEGYQVVTAFNGHEALGVARIEQPDLVLLDVMLPKENGYQVARYLREDERNGVIGKRMKILLLTARQTPEKAREEFLKSWSGADLLLYKPFDMDDLLVHVREALAEREPDRRWWRDEDALIA
jgi:two-component system response regulator VicR